MLRRARVLMAAGRRLSAMAEVQRAMIRALEPVASDTRGLGPQVIDAARVLAHGGTVQLGGGGDPDLAAAAVDAADWLGGVLQQLVPWTMTSAEARITAADIETWRQSVYGTSGNQDAG